MASLSDSHPVASFLAVTFAFSWLAWLLGFLAFDGQALGFASVVVGGFGPMVGAVAVRRLRGEPVKAWLRDLLRVRVAPRWYLLAVAIPLAFSVVHAAYLAAAGATLSPSLVAERLPGYLGSLVFVFFLGGGQEEFGWRGFMLPRLQAAHGAAAASLAIGVAWALWHLPLFALPGAIYADRPFTSYVAVPLVLAFVYTWLYNRADRALPVVMLLHAGTNSAGTLVPVPADALTTVVSGTEYHLVQAAGALLVLALALAVSGRRALDYRDDAGSPSA